jgi:Protein of unknown function (DUF3800)
MPASPTIVMDEAGNTGENLLDRQQPVYTLAALRISQEAADNAVGAALSRTQMSELKFAKLRNSAPGRRNLLALLDDLKLTPENASLAAAHKAWMLSAKLVDELVEPRMLRAGVQPQWYASGDAKRMATALYEDGRRTLRDVYDDLASSFVPLVRDYDDDKANDFLSALRRARIACRDEQLLFILEGMIDTPEDLAAEFDGRDDALDPAMPSLGALGGYWSRQIDEPFNVLHDDSNTVKRWAHLLEIARHRAERIAAGEDVAPASFTLGEITVDLPVGIQKITFAQSHGDSRLQVADVLAGAGAHLCEVLSGSRAVDGFARELHRRRIGSLIQNWVGPDFDEAQVRQLR